MRKETKIYSTVDKACIHFEGTETIQIKDLMKLTDNHPIEIVAEGDGVKVTLNLMQILKENTMTGQCLIETTEREPTE